jgi:RNA polymerase sigma factor (sigma-70 family)
VTRYPDPETQRNAVVAAWYTQFSRRVYVLAFKACRGDHYQAEEIVHETFAAVLKQFDSTFKDKPRPQVEAMLCTIARRRAIDHFRKINKVSVSEDLDDLDCGVGLAPDSSDDPLVRVIDRETSERLWQVLRQHLTPMEHAVAMLSWDWRWPDAAVARALGIPTVETVRSHRSRAKSKIRTYVRNNIVFPERLHDTTTDGGEEVTT